MNLSERNRLLNTNAKHNLKKTPSAIIKLLESFSKGATITQAADSIGVVRDTLQRWLANDEILAEQVRVARANYALSVLNPKLAEKDPYKYLKALYPEDFRDEPQTVINLNDIKMLSDSELMAKAEAILKGKDVVEVLESGPTPPVVNNIATPSDNGPPPPDDTLPHSPITFDPSTQEIIEVEIPQIPGSNVAIVEETSLLEEGEWIEADQGE